jgi:hypothetical protein
MGVKASQAPTAWATTLPTAGASTLDPWTTLIPRLRGHPDGVVIVAIIYGREHLAPQGLVPTFPRRTLPLQLSDALVQHRWEGMPNRNVVQLALTARVRGYLVQLDAYFPTQHPPRRQVARAQQELQTLAIPTTGHADAP